MYLQLAKQLIDLESKEDITPELLNNLLNAYQELSVDYYKSLDNRVTSMDGLIFAREMYERNFDEIMSILEENEKNA